MHRHKYPRAQEVLHTIQALEGKEAILRTRVTGDYDFDPAKVFFQMSTRLTSWPKAGRVMAMKVR